MLKISCPLSASLQAEMRLNRISTAASPHAFVVAASFSIYPSCHGETASQQPNITIVQSCQRRTIGSLHTDVRAYTQASGKLKGSNHASPLRSLPSHAARCAQS